MKGYNLQNYLFFTLAGIVKKLQTYSREEKLILRRLTESYCGLHGMPFTIPTEEEIDFLIDILRKEIVNDFMCESISDKLMSSLIRDVKKLEVTLKKYSIKSRRNTKWVKRKVQ